jgi:hypothetical protein
LGPIWEACPGGPGPGIITPTPDFGAEVSYTIRKAWYIYKTGCAVLFQHVWPCILVPRSFLEATKNNPLFWLGVSRNWGMTAGRDTLF